MRRKEQVLKVFGGLMFAIAGGLTLLMLQACTSKSNSGPQERESTSQKVSTNAASAKGFDGGTYCVQTFLQGPAPASPLHFSNQIVESDPSLKSKYFETDYAGDTVDVVHRETWLATDQDRQFFQDSQKFTDPKVVTRAINNGVAEETITNHAARSDGVSWRGAIMGVSQGATPWNLFVSKPTVNLVGPDSVNGFDTVKYAVDTTHQDASDKAALKAFNHLTNYDIVGTAWVLKGSNCVLQYNIDYQETSKDGKSSKTHYEGTITKK